MNTYIWREYPGLLEQWKNLSYLFNMFMWWENSVEFIQNFSESVKFNESSLKIMKESRNFAAKNYHCI